MMEESLNFEENYKKIKNLILSSEVPNILLGLELLTNFSYHPKLISLLSVVYLHSKGTEGFEELSKTVEQTLQKFLTSEHFLFLKEKIDEYIEENYEDGYFGFIYLDLLRCLENSTFLDFNELANIFLIFNRHLLAYCISHQTAPTLLLLRQAICETDEGVSLFMNDAGFAEIPKEIGMISELNYLQITNNPIQDVPDEMANLKNLKNLHLNVKNFKPQALQKLETWFPKIMANNYFLQEVQILFEFNGVLKNKVRKKQLLNAIFWLDKCILLDTENAKYASFKTKILELLWF